MRASARRCSPGPAFEEPTNHASSCPSDRWTPPRNPAVRRSKQRVVAWANVGNREAAKAQPIPSNPLPCTPARRLSKSTGRRPSRSAADRLDAGVGLQCTGLRKAAAGARRGLIRAGRAREDGGQKLGQQTGSARRTSPRGRPAHLVEPEALASRIFARMRSIGASATTRTGCGPPEVVAWRSHEIEPPRSHRAPWLGGRPQVSRSPSVPRPRPRSGSALLARQRTSSAAGPIW